MRMQEANRIRNSLRSSQPSIVFLVTAPRSQVATRRKRRLDDDYWLAGLEKGAFHRDNARVPQLGSSRDRLLYELEVIHAVLLQNLPRRWQLCGSTAQPCLLHMWLAMNELALVAIAITVAPIMYENAGVHQHRLHIPLGPIGIIELRIRSLRMQNPAGENRKLRKCKLILDHAGWRRICIGSRRSISHSSAELDYPAQVCTTSTSEQLVLFSDTFVFVLLPLPFNITKRQLIDRLIHLESCRVPAAPHCLEINIEPFELTQSAGRFLAVGTQPFLQFQLAPASDSFLGTSMQLVAQIGDPFLFLHNGALGLPNGIRLTASVGNRAH
mmetsp:Transcript_1560/g.5015  ORF Transcript_1560/g.5015 Transcript_1560/m.5015 type:complete len:327 (-) Transcript_1560:1320-2300(-)